MPSSVIVSGKKISKPGVYGVAESGGLGGKRAAKGNVAIVGAFPYIQNDVPQRFVSSKLLAAVNPADADLALLAKLAFDPANDDAVGGASSVTLVNVQTVTQAGYTFDDIAGADSLVLKASLWGQKGNQTYAKLNTNATDAKGIDVTLVRDGTTETFPNLQSGKVFEAIYDGGELTTSLLSVSPTEWKWAFTKAIAALPGGGANPNQSVYSPAKFLITGKLTVQLSAPAPAAGVTVTVVGLNEAAVPKTLVLTFAVGQAGPSVVQDGGVDALWSAITSITVASTDLNSTLAATVSGNAFLLNPANFSSVGAMVSLINNNSAKGFKATAIHPKITAIPAAQIDKQTSVSVVSPALLTGRADLWAIVQGLAGSTLVTASRATSADLPPKHWNQGPATSEEVMLLGGTESAVSVATDYAQALSKITNKDVQEVVVLSDDIEAGKALKTHCADAALAGYERNGYQGATKDKTAQEVYTGWSAILNTRHVSVCMDEVQLQTPLNGPEWKEPKYLAVLLAGMQAGVPTGTPLTNKRPDVLDVRSKREIGNFAEDNDAIEKGIYCLTRDDLGFAVLRSITTNLVDDEGWKCEVSANESINTSIRELRGFLKAKIGDSVTGASANQLAGLVEAALDQQVTDGTIKAWRNAEINLSGDTYSIDYEPAPIEPFNFAKVTVRPARF